MQQSYLDSKPKALLTAAKHNGVDINAVRKVLADLQKTADKKVTKPGKRKGDDATVATVATVATADDNVEYPALRLYLSIRQRWAWLIVNGHKDIENRTCSTGTRGPILVHASMGTTQSEYEAACAFIESKERLRHLNAILPMPMPKDLERGGIVGQADITDCVRDHQSPWFVGEFGFVLRHAKPLPFRLFTGALQFFEVPGGDLVVAPAPQSALF